MINAVTEPTLHILPDPQAMFAHAARRLARLLHEALQQRPLAHLALAGGNTPRLLYRALVALPAGQSPEWQRVHFYFGDERAVVPDHPEANYRMAKETLLTPLGIAEERIHRIHAEAPPEQALSHYRRVLRQLPQRHHLPCFDVILLGMGHDGHVASLFPGSALLADRQHTFTSAMVAHLNARRYSLTLPVLNNARNVLLLVSGQDKADIVQQALTHTRAALPVQLLQPDRLEWFLDRPAAHAIHSGEQECLPPHNHR